MSEKFPGKKTLSLDFDGVCHQYTQHKPKAFVGLDDRIITFYGQWPSVSSLRNFKPWNKGGPTGVAVHMPPGYRTITFSVTAQQLDDLHALLFTEKRRGMLTGGSEVAAEDKRRRDTFEHLYRQLPPLTPPDVQQS